MLKLTDYEEELVDKLVEATGINRDLILSETEKWVENSKDGYVVPAEMTPLGMLITMKYEYDPSILE